MRPASLASSTHAANHHASQELVDGGGLRTFFARDSTARRRVEAAVQALLPARLRGTAGPRLVAPWVAPTPKVHANRLRKAASDGALIARVEEFGASLSCGADRPDAASRLAALAERVRHRHQLASLEVGVRGGWHDGGGVGPHACSSTGDQRRVFLLIGSIARQMSLPLARQWSELFRL